MRDELSPISSLRLWNALVECLGQSLQVSPSVSMTLTRVELGDRGESSFTEIATAYGKVWARFLSLPIGALTQTNIDQEALANLPQPLGEAVRAVALSKFCSAFTDEQTRMVLSVRSEVSAVPVVPTIETLEAAIDGPWGERVVLSICAEWTVLASLTRLLHMERTQVLPNALAQFIPMTVSHVLVGRTLSTQTVSLLDPGDILVLDQREEIVTGEGFVLRLSRLDEKYVVQEVRMSEESSIEIEYPTQSTRTDEALQSVGDIPVKISFMIAEHVVSLADLQSMKVGSMIPLDLAYPTTGSPVRILANGKIIGHGNLVEVDGTTAVRFSKLFGQD